MYLINTQHSNSYSKHNVILFCSENPRCSAGRSGINHECCNRSDCNHLGEYWTTGCCCEGNDKRCKLAVTSVEVRNILDHEFEKFIYQFLQYAYSIVFLCRKSLKMEVQNQLQHMCHIASKFGVFVDEDHNNLSTL